jgi:hypothetical protein
VHLGAKTLHPSKSSFLLHGLLSLELQFEFITANAVSVTIHHSTMFGCFFDKTKILMP